jgi:hypothetical protein
MSVSNDSTARTTDAAGALRSTAFLDFCAKVRTNDPSILPELGQPFEIRHSSEKGLIELADALLQNTNITYLNLRTGKYTKSSAEAMAKYVRTSKRLQRIHWNRQCWRVLPEREEMLLYFLSAFQEKYVAQGTTHHGLTNF